jgi:hypothetical protein
MRNFERYEVLASRDRTIIKYPALADKQSPVRKRFDAFIRLKQDDPLYESVFASPHWPELMADHFFATIKNPGLPRTD